MTVKTAPPASPLATPMRPPSRVTMVAAMARPSPVPPPGALLARQKRSKTRGRVVGRDARSLVGYLEHGTARITAHAHDDAAAMRAVAHRVVEQDGDELTNTKGVRLDHHRLGVDLDPDVAVSGRHRHGGRGVGRRIAELDRLQVEVQRSRVGTR